MNKDDMKDEYGKSIDILKHLATIQCAQLSVFLAFMVAGVAFLFGDKKPEQPMLGMLKIGMTFLAVFFWAMQESHMYVLGHFIKRIAVLEGKLGYGGFSKLKGMPEYKYPIAKISLRMIYLIITSLWCIVVFKSTD